MPLPAPNLDDRRFQDILDEARRLIPRYCKEWTDHNLSDPGITLLELFAWMTDLLLYRLNRVPDKNYIKFMELLGIQLQAAQPATTDITFGLSAALPEDTLIPAGTAVGTLRTETQEAVSFATVRDLVIRVPRLAHVLGCRAGDRFVDYTPALSSASQGFGVFSDRPVPDDGLYLGFDNDLSAHVLALSIGCRTEGHGVDPDDPPLAWETWNALDHRWSSLRVERDDTGGFNEDGVVIVHLPYEAGPTSVDNRRAWWIRARVLEPRPGQEGYRDSPRVTRVEVHSRGAMVPARHSTRIVGEPLGTSDGSPGQVVRLQNPPILARVDGEHLEVEGEDGAYEPWQEVPDFGASGPNDRHYVLDDATGCLELGPRIRSPHGREQQFGRVPPLGCRLRFSAYRTGGGVVGNVGARTLSVLQSSIPYVDSVVNETPAVGGTDTEDIEHAKWRAPQVLRATERAVTPEDFELLGRLASTGVARARCVPAADGSQPGAPAPGSVRLQLVPALPLPSGPLSIDDTQVPPRIRQEVQAYLDERRLLGTELVLESVAYTWVSVVANVRARAGASRARIADQAAEALYRYIHPTTGGPEGDGWPFGRELFAGELYAILQAIEGVDLIVQIDLYEVDPSTRQFGAAANRLAPRPAGLLCSHEHRIQVD